MRGRSGFHWFRDDVCPLCGLCFEKCPTLELSSRDGEKEIEMLIKGETKYSLVYQFCTTCNTCDLICPFEANPYELILERWNESYKSHGLPGIAKLIFPNERENMWSSIRVLIDRDESLSLLKWERNFMTNFNDNPRETVLISGTYTNLVPYLLKTSLLDEFKHAIAGSEALWVCAGDLYKLGLNEESDNVGRLLLKMFSEMNTKKIYFFMGSEAMMLNDIFPKRFGIDFSRWKPEPIDSWILDKLRKKEIKLIKKLRLNVAVHDNCTSKYMGMKFQNTLREIVKYTGCNIVEMKHNRESGLCCGWAATIPTLYEDQSNNPLHTLSYLLYSLHRRLMEVEDSGAQAVVVSCPACYIFLSLIKVLLNSKIEVYHYIELVQMAAGEKPIHKNDERAWDLLAIFLDLFWKWLFTKHIHRYFFLKPIDIKPIPKIRRGDEIRLWFLSRLLHSRIIQNRMMRSLISHIIISVIMKYDSYIREKKTIIEKNR